jgi:hypothetical protein
MAVTVTISTPINLAQYAQTLPETDPTRTFVENMVAESDIMRALPMLPAERGKRAYMDIAALPTVGFRALNTGGNQGTGDYNLREEDTFFIDEYVYVDRALIDRLGPEHKYRQERLKSIALSQMFTTKLVNGDRTSSPSEPDGLKARCGRANTNLFVNNVAANGGPLSLANMDILYWSVNKPSHFIVPRGLMPYFDAAARNNTLVNQTVQYAEDDFGRRIIKFKGLPLLFGYEPDDSPDVLPFTEVGAGGGTATTSSIFCVSLRDGGFYAIEQTPLSVQDEGPIVGQPFESLHIKWDWGTAREHPRACSRLSSITAATIVA